MEGQSTVTPSRSPFATPKKTASLDSTLTLVPPECPRKRRHEDTFYQRCDFPKLPLDCPLLSINDSSFETPKLQLRPRLSSLSSVAWLEHDCEVWTWDEEVKASSALADHQVQPIRLFKEGETSSTKETAARDNLEARPRVVSWSEESESMGPPVDELCTPESKRLRYVYSPGPNRYVNLQPRKTESLPLYPLSASYFLPL